VPLCKDARTAAIVVAMAARPKKRAVTSTKSRSPRAEELRRAKPSGAPFRLTLLGRFQLAGPHGNIDLGSRKLCGLLAFLACTAPEPQPRDRLMTLFWGSHFDAQARQNLRQALSRLRRALGDGVIVGDDEAVTLTTGAVACDVTAFELAIRTRSSDALEAAVGLYQGAFLTSVTIKEEGWSDWVAAQRTRLEGLAVRTMTQLGEQELKEGRAERALELAERVIGIDGLLEDAQRLSFRALAVSGRRAESLKRYEQFASLLKRELDVAPDAAT
jgi:DNA-binding SARP family transcriptional activator